MEEKLDWRTIDTKGDLATAFRLAVAACNEPNAYDGVFSLEYKENYDFGEYGRSSDEDGNWVAEMHLSDFKYSCEAWANTPEEALLQVTVKFLAAKEMRPIEIKETVDAVDKLDELTIRELLKKELDKNMSYNSSQRFNLFAEVRKIALLPKSVENR